MVKGFLGDELTIDIELKDKSELPLMFLETAD